MTVFSSDAGGDRDPAVDVAEATSVDEELCSALARLLPQLSARSRSAPDWVRRIVESSAVRLLIARDRDRRIVGTACLVLVPLPSGLRARLEDVVVDAAARGQGVGRALTVEAVARARAAGARDLDLTSRPERSAAIGMYEAAGFVRRRTNVYRHELTGDQGS